MKNIPIHQSLAWKTTGLLFICLCYLLSTCAGNGKPNGKNLLNDMTTKEWRALNIFVSNFNEAGLDNYNAASYDVNELVSFAMCHHVVNNLDFGHDEKQDSEYFLTDKQVMNTIEKYFGITGLVVPDGEVDYFIRHANGRFYLDDVLEGFPSFIGAQVVELYDNGDGTLTARIEEYGDNEEFHKNYIENYATMFYDPMNTWKSGVAERCVFTGYRVAKIGKHTYKGKEIYKLLDWQKAEIEGVTIGMMEEFNDGNNIAEIPMIHYEGDNPELMMLNNDIKANVMLPYNEFMDNKEEYESIRIKTYTFTNDGKIQFIITRAIYPNYATDGDILSYNYNKKTNKWESLEVVLGTDMDFSYHKEIIRDKFKAIGRANESVKEIELKAYRTIDAETMEYFVKITVDNPDSDPWDGIFRYVYSIEDQELKRLDLENPFEQ